MAAAIGAAAEARQALGRARGLIEGLAGGIADPTLWARFVNSSRNRGVPLGSL